MIGRVLCGANVAGLLRYLYGLGKVNEHNNPRLVAGFDDPAALEPLRRAGGAADLRGCTPDCWASRWRHCIGRAMTSRCGTARFGPPRVTGCCRTASGARWRPRSCTRTGLAARDDDAGVRWVTVRHADDHIHLVATLARQDGFRPRTWNDFYRVREACQAIEAQFGLRATAPADHTAARRPSRAETEQTARRGWTEPPRIALPRMRCGCRTQSRNASSSPHSSGPGLRSASGTAPGLPVKSPVMRSACQVM